VTTVEDITGDASVAVVSGKKRYIFDFHCKVNFEIKHSESDKVVAKGTLRLPDICSAHHEELEVDFDGWKKSPSSGNQQVAHDCRMAVVSEIRESVKLWVEDFNKHY
jgi:activator of HSP90 ATPase